VIKDFKKLDSIKIKNKWVIAFVYPKPDDDEWKKLVSELNRWKCITKLENYSQYLFIVLFKG